MQFANMHSVGMNKWKGEGKEGAKKATDGAPPASNYQG